MPLIITVNTTISSDTQFTQDVQIAAGVTVTVLPGATLDLGGHTLVNYGTVALLGSDSAFAALTNGKYSTDSTSGTLTSNFGWLQGVRVDGFFSRGALNLDSTVVSDSLIDGLATTRIEDSIFVNSPLDIGIETDFTVTRTTFKDSLISSDAWPSSGSSATFTQSNFVTSGLAIDFNPFFSGAHAVSFASSYMYVPAGSTFEDKVYDSGDDLRVATDISSSTFVSQPYLTSASGFSVGSYSLSLVQLGITASGQPILGSNAADQLNGTAADDTLFGLGGNDLLFGAGGNDALDGGVGFDTAIFTGVRSGYAIATTGTSTFTVHTDTGFEGTDTLTGIERIQFTNQSVNLTVGDLAHTITASQLDSIIELYIAYINRVPDADGMAFWIGQLKAGQTLNQIGESFYNAAVHFGSLTGYSSTMTDGEFVTLVYRNVLGRNEPDAGGLAFWSNELATGHSSRGTLVAAILGSAHSFKGRADYGWVADLLDNKITVGKEFAVDQGLVYNTSEDSISHGMAIAAAVTPSSTSEAITLIGVSDGFSLLA